MLDSNYILSLLSIPSETVLSFSVINDTDDIYYIDIELKDNRPSVCPFCFNNQINIKDYYNVKIKNSIIIMKKLYINIKVRRYICKNCKKSFKQQFKLYDDNKSISKKVIENIKLMTLDPVSFSYISKMLDVSTQTVINVFDELPEPTRLPLGKVICIDEFHFSNANTSIGKYPCVISNPFTTEIIDIIESRRKVYLEAYFKTISYTERTNVKYYITDMNETYRVIKKMFFKNAVHIIDHFHVVKLFTEAIQQIRIRIMKNYPTDTKAYKYLKKNWSLFLKNRFDLKESTYINKKTGVIYYTLDDIDMVLRAYPDLFYAYWCKEEFSNYMLKLHEYKETESKIDFFINKYENSNIKEIVNISNTFKNWRKEIINGYSKNTYGVVLTNAMAESNNNYIQTLIDVGYGYSNFKRLRKRLLYMSSNKQNKKQPI